MADQSTLKKALSWVADVDVPGVQASVATLKEKHPGAGKQELAKAAFSKSAWQATAMGIATGLPSNPWVAAPAALIDLAAVLKVEIVAAAKVAVIYDEHFFDQEDAKWELFMPVFGMRATGELLREAGIHGGKGVTRQLIRSTLSKEMLRTLRGILLKYLGIKLTQRTFSKAVPLVGGVIGGTWNYMEVRSLRKRCINYFEGKAME